MALINCPMCGRQISDRAVNCPGCGNRIGQTVGYSNGASQQMSYTGYTNNANQGCSVNAGGADYKSMNGYRDILKFILLLIFTFGIYYLYWVYKTTEFLNDVDPYDPKQTPTNQLLLCMFVPFYFLYWTYKNAQRIDSYAKNNGIESDIAILSLIISLFVVIVGDVIMQDKINNVIKKQQYGEDTITQNNGNTTNVKNMSTNTYSSSNDASNYNSVSTSSDKLYEERQQIDLLLKLKEIKDSGILTDEEFEMKKAEILNK